MYMKKVTISELNENLSEYVEIAQDQDIFITQNGKVVAKLVTAKADKVAAAKELFRLLPKGTDIDLDKIREERILR